MRQSPVVKDHLKLLIFVPPPPLMCSDYSFHYHVQPCPIFFLLLSPCLLRGFPFACTAYLITSRRARMFSSIFFILAAFQIGFVCAWYDAEAQTRDLSHMLYKHTTAKLGHISSLNESISHALYSSLLFHSSVCQL